MTKKYKIIFYAHPAYPSIDYKAPLKDKRKEYCMNCQTILDNIMEEPNRYPYTGENDWTILNGDSNEILQTIKPDSFDALITDPPYASGGTGAEKNRPVSKKYSSLPKELALPEFDGDYMDQISWVDWTTAWLGHARRVCKTGAFMAIFIDWRQLFALYRAINWSGWIIRGVAVWHKTNCRPQRDRPRQEVEFVLWGSKGPLPMGTGVGCQPGFYEAANTSSKERIHMTQKPLTVMRQVVKNCIPGGLILDPFCGGASTVLAAVLEGYKAIGIEVTDAYYKLGTDRVRFALQEQAT